jgi:hypothetical protein
VPAAAAPCARSARSVRAHEQLGWRPARRLRDRCETGHGSVEPAEV